MKTVAFIDASNLFYGGKKSLGWSIDYEKLLGYLKEKYGIERAYFSAVSRYTALRSTTSRMRRCLYGSSKVTFSI